MIYLVSTSPRRKKLLREAGVRFRVLRPKYHERHIPGLRPDALVKRHAYEKAMSAVSLVKEGVLLSADTVVCLDGHVIGKPKNIKDAVRILSKLQGRWHTVYTGVALLKLSAGRITKKKVFSEKTGVFIKKMSRADIRSYFRRISPLDKAGAYAIQSTRASIVEKFKGSHSNAVGLPMERLRYWLKHRLCQLGKFNS